MRTLLRWWGVGLVVAGCGGDGAMAPSPPRKTLSATQSASGNHQSGGVATKLPLPLRVVVESAGGTLPGVTVTWRASGGALVPASGVTDAGGIATATWTLDTVAGTKTATATVSGLGDTVTFGATALASGPAVSIRKVFGDSQTVGVNAAFLDDVGVVVVDRYGNSVPGEVTWSIESGPVAFADLPSRYTDVNGFVRARLRPLGTEGVALVEASLVEPLLVGGAPSVHFRLTVGPPQFVVLLRLSTFASVQNGTNPAVDTIPAGGSVVWKLDFDYDRHRVVSVGTPSFPTPGDFPYTLHPKVSVMFTVPGTYHYTDFYNSAATGTVVVQ